MSHLTLRVIQQAEHPNNVVSNCNAESQNVQCIAYILHFHENTLHFAVGFLCAEYRRELGNSSLEFVVFKISGFEI